MISYRRVFGEEAHLIRSVRRAGYSQLGRVHPFFLDNMDKLSEPEPGSSSYFHIAALKNEQALGAVTLHIPDDPCQVHSSKFFDLGISGGSRAGEILKLFVVNPGENYITGYNLIFAAFEELRKNGVGEIFINFIDNKKEFYLKFGHIIGTIEVSGLTLFCLRVDIPLVEKKFEGLFRRFRGRVPFADTLSPN